MMTFRERACTVWKSRVTGVPMSQWKVLKAGAQPFDCYYYCVRFLVFFQNNVTWQCRRCTNISASFLTDQNLFKKKKDLRIGPVQVVDVSSGKKSKTLLANVM